jgi:hypothetical protein
MVHDTHKDQNEYNMGDGELNDTGYRSTNSGTTKHRILHGYMRSTSVTPENVLGEKR